MAKEIPVLIFSLIMFGLSGLLTYQMIRDHLHWRRYDRARELIVEIGDLTIDQKLEPKEAAHLMNILGNPTAAVIKLVEDRIEEAKA